MNPHDKCTRNRSRIVSNMLRTSRLGSLARRGATRSACFSSSSSKSGASGVITIVIVDTPGRYNVEFGSSFVVRDSSAASTTAIYGATFWRYCCRLGSSPPSELSPLDHSLSSSRSSPRAFPRRSTDSRVYNESRINVYNELGNS